MRHAQNPSFCAEKRKAHLTEPNVPIDQKSHKSGPNFFTENVARNGLKPRFWAQKMLRSAVRTPICQIVPVSCVYNPPPPLVLRFTQRMDLRERSGVTCVNLHFRSVGVTCVNLSFVRGLLGTGPPRTPPSHQPRPSLLKGRFGIDSTSIRHWFDIKIGSNQEIDVESMSNRC